MLDAANFITHEPQNIDSEKEKSILVPENLSFHQGSNTLLLEVDKSGINLSNLEKMADKDGLERRDEFHITILGFKNGNEINKVLKKLPEAERQNKVLQLQSLVNGADWSYVLQPQKYHISKEYVTPDPKNKGAELKERRESYIQMVDLPGMNIFYDELNALFGTNLETPPAHITLYTGGDDKEKSKMGIGINSQDELLKLNPELMK